MSYEHFSAKTRFQNRHIDVCFTYDIVEACNIDNHEQVQIQIQLIDIYTRKTLYQ